ncbi:hypothetical protein CCR85_04840 [Rhodothalassium salexigens]|nr:hypothetical protein [Rhodothalassium salexigens]
MTDHKAHPCGRRPRLPALSRTRFGALSLALLTGLAGAAGVAAAQEGAGATAATATTHAEAALPPLEAQTVTPARGGLDAARQAIEDYLNGIDTLRADFVQIGPDGGMTRGVLKIDRPGRLRFDYDDETPLLLVSDGATLTFIDYEVGQVTRWPIDETPLGLLVRDRIDLDDPAATGLDLAFNPGALAGYWVLEARNPDGDIPGTVDLTFVREAQTGVRLLGWEVVDAQGYVTRVSLSDVTLGQTFADSTWTFDDPRGLPAKRRRRGR